MKIKVLKSDCYHIKNISNFICYDLPFEVNSCSTVLISGSQMLLGDIFGDYFCSVYEVLFNTKSDAIIFTHQNVVLRDTPVDVKLDRLSDTWT